MKIIGTVVAMLVVLTACSSRWVETNIPSSNPSAVDFCERRPENVLCNP